MDALASELALESRRLILVTLKNHTETFSWVLGICSLVRTSKPFLQPENFLTKFDFRQFHICTKYTSTMLTPTSLPPLSLPPSSPQISHVHDYALDFVTHWD